MEGPFEQSIVHRDDCIEQSMGFPYSPDIVLNGSAPTFMPENTGTVSRMMDWPESEGNLTISMLFLDSANPSPCSSNPTTPMNDLDAPVVPPFFTDGDMLAPSHAPFCHFADGYGPDPMASGACSNAYGQSVSWNTAANDRYDPYIHDLCSHLSARGSGRLPSSPRNLNGFESQAFGSFGSCGDPGSQGYIANNVEGLCIKPDPEAAWQLGCSLTTTSLLVIESMYQDQYQGTGILGGAHGQSHHQHGGVHGFELGMPNVLQPRLTTPDIKIEPDLDLHTSSDLGSIGCYGAWNYGVGQMWSEGLGWESMDLRLNRDVGTHGSHSVTSNHPDAGQLHSGFNKSKATTRLSNRRYPPIYTLPGSGVEQSITPPILHGPPRRMSQRQKMGQEASQLRANESEFVPSAQCSACSLRYGVGGRVRPSVECGLS